MGVVERIRQIQEEQARKAAEAEAARNADLQKAKQERLLVEEKEKQRKNLIILQNEKIWTDSGLLERIQEIQTELSKKEIKNEALLFPEKGRIVLIWGEGYYKNEDTNIHSPGDWDYSWVEILTNPDKKDILIKGTKTFKINRTLPGRAQQLDDAIVFTFINPNHNFGHEDLSGWDGSTGGIS